MKGCSTVLLLSIYTVPIYIAKMVVFIDRHNIVS